MDMEHLLIGCGLRLSLPSDADQDTLDRDQVQIEINSMDSSSSLLLAGVESSSDPRVGPSDKAWKAHLLHPLLPDLPNP